MTGLPSVAWRGADPAGILPELVDPAPLLAELLTPPAWHRHAACRGAGPDLFHPARGASLRRARELCAGCPVLDDCRAWIDEHESNRAAVGVWAGESAQERVARRRGRPLPSAHPFGTMTSSRSAGPSEDGPPGHVGTGLDITPEVAQVPPPPMAQAAEPSPDRSPCPDGRHPLPIGAPDVHP